MNLDGIWQVTYATKRAHPFTETGDAEQLATIKLKDGLASGRDPWGGEYTGNYWVDGDEVKATVIASAYEGDAESIFEGVSYPFSLELSGKVSSPSFFSMVGRVINQPAAEIVLNFTRVSSE